MDKGENGKQTGDPYPPFSIFHFPFSIFHFPFSIFSILYFSILNSKTEGLYTSIKSDAQLTLKGMTDAYNIEMDKTARITLDRFVSKKTDMSATDVYVAARR